MGNGSTPTLVASQLNASESLRLLIGARGDVNYARADNGATPVFLASQNKALACLRLLIDAHGQVNCARTDYGDTPVTPVLMALENNAHECLRLLVSARADLTITSNGYTPVALAQARGHEAAVDLLLAAFHDQAAEIRCKGGAGNEITEAVQLVDKDGDCIVFQIESGCLQELVNGNVEIERLRWLQVNRRSGHLRDAGGDTIVVDQASALGRLAILCGAAGVAWIEEADGLADKYATRSWPVAI